MSTGLVCENSQQRLFQIGAELVVALRPAGEADDGKVVRQQAVFGQVIERRDDLAMGQVAGRPEDDRRWSAARVAARESDRGMLGGSTWQMDMADDPVEDVRLGVVGARRDGAALARPVRVEELGRAACPSARRCARRSSRAAPAAGWRAAARCGRNRRTRARWKTWSPGCRASPPSATVRRQPSCALRKRLGEEAVEHQVGQLPGCGRRPA